MRPITLQPGGKLVSSAKAAVPTVGDQAAAMSLTNASKNLATALTELRSALSKAQEACGSLEIDGALDQVHALERDLELIRTTAQNGQLVPLPGEDVSCYPVGLTSISIPVFSLRGSPSVTGGKLSHHAGRHLQDSRLIHGTAVNGSRSGQ